MPASSTLETSSAIVAPGDGSSDGGVRLSMKVRVIAPAPAEIIVLEGAGHPCNFCRAGAGRLGGFTPLRGHGRDLFDDCAGLLQC